MLIKNIISQRYKGTQREKWEQFLKNYKKMIQAFKNKEI